jgi:tRNA threonylcarbamoyl adenosine modification protein (Sua5/YciO/YrdC/YwlC family)
MILNINIQNPDQDKIQQTVEVLRQGGIIVYPTDTIYGLGCDIFNKQAITKIYQLKKREGHKPMSIICSSIADISKYAVIPDSSFAILKKCLPGPFTFILKAKNIMPSNFLAKNKTVGIRVPDNQICLEIVKRLGNPIITTSLNLANEKVMTSPSQLPKEIKNNLDLIIDSGNLPQEPSTVVDLSNEEPTILRQGKGIFPLL